MSSVGYRLMMEERLGRRLQRDEVVHHVNGDHDDNRIENLRVMTRGEHTRLHMAVPDHLLVSDSERRLLGDYRKLMGVTQVEIAKAVGVTQAAVSQWESGDTPLSCAHYAAVVAELERIEAQRQAAFATHKQRAVNESRRVLSDPTTSARTRNAALVFLYGAAAKQREAKS